MASQLDKRVAWAVKMHGDGVKRRLEQMMDGPVEDHDVVNWVGYTANLDPTAPKYKMLGWLVARWVDEVNTLREDDLPKAKETLELFLASRPALPAAQRDISAYRSLPELDAVLEQFRENPYLSESEKDRRHEAELLASGAAVVVWDADDCKVVRLETEEAAKWFGRGTRWCTAAENHNCFGHYSDGPLHVVQCRGKARRFQFFWGGGWSDAQLMDELDRETSMDELRAAAPSMERWERWTRMVSAFGTADEYCAVCGDDPGIQSDLARATDLLRRHHGLQIIMRLAPHWFLDAEFCRYFERVASEVVEQEWLLDQARARFPDEGLPWIRAAGLMLVDLGCAMKILEPYADGPHSFSDPFASALFSEWAAAHQELFAVGSPRGLGDLTTGALSALFSSAWGTCWDAKDWLQRGLWSDEQLKETIETAALIGAATQAAGGEVEPTVIALMSGAGVLARLGWRLMADIAHADTSNRILPKDAVAALPVDQQVRFAIACPYIVLTRQEGVADEALIAAARNANWGDNNVWAWNVHRDPLRDAVRRRNSPSDVRVALRASEFARCLADGPYYNWGLPEGIWPADTLLKAVGMFPDAFWKVEQLAMSDRKLGGWRFLARLAECNPSRSLSCGIVSQFPPQAQVKLALACPAAMRDQLGVCHRAAAVVLRLAPEHLPSDWAMVMLPDIVKREDAAAVLAKAVSSDMLVSSPLVSDDLFIQVLNEGKPYHAEGIERRGWRFLARLAATKDGGSKMIWVAPKLSPLHQARLAGATAGSSWWQHAKGVARSTALMVARLAPQHTPWEWLSDEGVVREAIKAARRRRGDMPWNIFVGAELQAKIAAEFPNVVRLWRAAPAPEALRIVAALKGSFALPDGCSDLEALFLAYRKDGELLAYRSDRDRLPRVAFNWRQQFTLTRRGANPKLVASNPSLTAALLGAACRASVLAPKVALAAAAAVVTAPLWVPVAAVVWLCEREAGPVGDDAMATAA